MQPYRQAAPNNSYLPIYWECRQCYCPACISSQGNESNATSTSNEVRRPSFTIDYLLSDEEQKPFKQRGTVPSFPVQCVSHAPDHFSKADGTHAPYHSGFVANFSRPSQFPMENMALLGSGSIQSEGPFLPHSEESDWPHQKPKRMRTIFTVEQLERLEREFTRQQYMVGGQRFYLSKELGLTETQVKVWFQNRRIKWRKQIIEQQRTNVRHQIETSTNTQQETHGY